jgi:hypothetical protein
MVVNVAATGSVKGTLSEYITPTTNEPLNENA